MSILDRIRGLFGRKQSGADHAATTAVVGGAVVASSIDDPARDVEPQSDFAGGESGGGWGGWGGGDGGGGGGDIGGGGAS